MALETIDINKDNIANDVFLTILSNISEKYNELLLSPDLTLDDIAKIQNQVLETYSFFKQLKGI